jgi:FkbM family methyltransferase
MQYQGPKEAIQELLRRGGLSVGAYRQSYRARRQRIIEAQRIELVADVGANDGRWVVELRRGGYMGRVISFEPDHRAYRRLCEVAAKDRAWDHGPVALGDETATLALSLNLSESDLWNSFVPISAETVEEEPKAQFVGVQCVSVEPLDEMLLCKDLLMVKIDVQGFERQIYGLPPRRCFEVAPL